MLWGFHFLCEDDVEADDVIATLSKFANDQSDIETIIASGDKDLFQLVGEKYVKQLDMKGKAFFRGS